jgi:pseudaminic acid biosynthesis-associated methylase
MDQTSAPLTEAQRLEQLWSGDFGNAYLQRNKGAGDPRQAFWERTLQRCAPKSALEVGCNLGGNLRWIAPRIGPTATFGIDISANALEEAHRNIPGIGTVCCPARDLPFRDRWFDLVFTMGVLIHQPESTLPLVMAEMVRCSRRWVLCGEYFSADTVEVPYRGHAGALFKRDYGGLFASQFPDLRLVEQGFLGKDVGWDDITWWLFERG